MIDKRDEVKEVIESFSKEKAMRQAYRVMLIDDSCILGDLTTKTVGPYFEDLFKCTIEEFIWLLDKAGYEIRRRDE